MFSIPVPLNKSFTGIKVDCIKCGGGHTFNVHTHTQNTQDVRIVNNNKIKREKQSITILILEWSQTTIKHNRIFYFPYFLKDTKTL